MTAQADNGRRRLATQLRFRDRLLAPRWLKGGPEYPVPWH